jgi:phosphoserine phosphatase
MTLIDDEKEQFTGLILLTGVDKPGISAALFETLSPFAISILDIEQIITSDRLILTVLIALNPSHQKAIETDLDECATNNEVDIATLFMQRSMMPVKGSLVDIEVTSPKLHPKSVSQICSQINSLQANVEGVLRTHSTPLTLRFTISGTTVAELLDSVSSLMFEDGSSVTVKAHI